MEPKFFVGIDISKLTLDIAVLHNNVVLTTLQIENSEMGFRQLLVKLKADFKCTRNNTLYCAEDMGVFASFLLAVCDKKKLRICMESPLRIKRSLGIQRGKTDTKDATRIAWYARSHYSQLRLWQAPRDCIVMLKDLFALRKKLTKIKVMLTNRDRMDAHFRSRRDIKFLKAHYQLTMDAARTNIRKVEQEMQALVSNDENLAELFRIITTIPQIGPVIATEIIIATNEFTTITTPKRFASYCGIAPFEWSSGSSLKGKPRVSHFANRELKTMLHM
ncbi:MAG TPA: transposase, partial [Chitinophagaceae bacterium]|nr:transposase [Chitinophagaceae bacterium]